MTRLLVAPNVTEGENIRLEAVQVLLDLLNHIHENRHLISYYQFEYSPVMYFENRLHILPSFTNEFIGKKHREIRKEWLRRGYTERFKVKVYGEFELRDNKNFKVGSKAKGTDAAKPFIVISNGFLRDHEFEFSNQFKK